MILGPILTLLLSEIAGWSALILTAAINTLLILLTGCAIAAVVSAICFLGASSRRGQRSRK